MADHIVRPIIRSIVRPIIRALTAPAGGGSSVPNPSDRTIVIEGDSITSSADSYSRLYQANAAPFFTSYTVAAVAGSNIAFLEIRKAANIARKVSPGSNIYTVMIGRNDLTSLGTTTWLTNLAAHLDSMRSAGFYVVLCTILPSTSVGFNAPRNTANTELRLWTTSGATIPGKHADAICDFDTTSMGPDAAASDVGLYSDGTHPTAAGQVILEALFRTVVNAQTQTGVVASPIPSVASGYYGAPQSVTLSSATAGSSIYYTLDSSLPSTASTLYTGAISVTDSQTIRTFATKAGMTNSAANDGIYTFGSQPATADGVAWYKFGAGVENASGGVARWEDRWFGRHLVQATVAKRPSYASSIISFDTVGDFLQKAFTLPQPCTIYALLRQDSWGNTLCLFDGATGNGQLAQRSTTPGLQAYSGTFSTQDNNAAIGTFVAVCVVFNGASSVLRVNNNAPVTGNFGSGTPGGITLGGTLAGSQTARVSFKEVVIYNVAHNTTAQDAEITRLLAL